MGVKRCLHHWPTRVLCVMMIILQAVSVNWYLMHYRSYKWAAIYGADAVVIALFLITFMVSSRNINKEKHSDHISFTDLQHLPLIYISWFVYIAVLDVKVGVIFSTFAADLKETDFFGPNTLKTSIAMTAIVFLAFVPTLNDIHHGTRRDLVISLTSAVTVDILDGVDNIEILFDVDVSDAFPPGLDEAIIIISCISFLFPIIPLFILAKNKFGLKTLSKKSIALLKFAFVYAVNCPLLVIRLYIWHGLSRGVSMFMLKNMMAIGVVTFETVEKLAFQRKRLEEKGTNQDRPDADNILNIIATCDR